MICIFLTLGIRIGKADNPSLSFVAIMISELFNNFLFLELYILSYKKEVSYFTQIFCLQILNRGYFL